MIEFNELVLPTRILIYAFNVAMASIIVCAIAAVLDRRLAKSLPLRHAILVAALSACVTAPTLVMLLQYWPLAGLRVAEDSPRANDDNTPREITDRSFSPSNPVAVLDLQPSASALGAADDALTTRKSYEESKQNAEWPIEAAGSVESRAHSQPSIMRILGTAATYVWLIGSGVVLSRLLIGMARLVRWSRSCRTSDSPLVLDALRVAANRAELQTLPPVCSSGALTAPMVYGLIKPKVVVPPEMATNLSFEQLWAVLLHELAHIARRDTWTGMLQQLSLILFWWNPLIHFANRRVSILREQICDDLVRAQITRPRDYAAALLSMAEQAAGTTPARSFVLGLSSVSQLEHRIRRILSAETSTNVRMTSVARAGVFTALVLMTSGVVFAQVRVESSAGSQPIHDGAPQAEVQGIDALAQVSAPAIGPVNDSATQTRVRELIYILRGHRVSQRIDEWGAAIRELASIGPPALPELLLELKNTERNAALRALLFTLRVINDRMALGPVMEALPKAERLSNRGSDFGLRFANADLHRFMKQHENSPSEDDGVAYGRPINEILGTLHKLAQQPLPDFAKPDLPATWRSGYWQEWWKEQVKSGRAKKQEEPIKLPSRNLDLVELEGVRRFGPLFPTGPKQRLSPVVEITLPGIRYANALSCLDFETGRIYENLEGLRYGSEKTHNRLDYRNWAISHGIDLAAHDGFDLHLWLIDNDRWDSLESEVQSGEPFDIGREALSLTPFDKDPTDFTPDQIGTFLFTTREGGRGAMRVYPAVSGQSRKIEFRLWNRDAIKPFPATQRQPPGSGEWKSTKTVLLKGPGFGNQCLYDFDEGKVEVLPASIPSTERLPGIEELLRRGGILRNGEIAAWARGRGIDLATSSSRVAFGGIPSDDVLKALQDGQIAALTILDVREMLVTAEAFDSLAVAHAREILSRNPSPFHVANMTPPLEPGTPPATIIFETKSRLIGLLQILKVGEKLSSIGFRYKLAENPK